MDLDDLNLLPVLQIIHVTDLHFKHVAVRGVEPLYAKRRFAARFLQDRIEQFNIGGWNEGTQGHYQKAPERFCRFLEWWRGEDDRWYAKSRTEDSAETWLIDTGDLTAFGDQASLAEGREWLPVWQEAAGAVQVRSIYGNHDAWPEVHPAHALFGAMRGEMDAQQERICNAIGWRRSEWLSEPCVVDIPGTRARIELYALNTVCWNSLENTLAVGRISEGDLASFRARLRAILLTHHPIVFPYGNVLPFVVSMGLKGADACVRELRNDRNDPAKLGPLAHLFLSGHTHIAYPAGKLCPNASEIYQGLLAANQLQLVGGSLMLNKASSAAKGGAAAGPSSVQVPKFSIDERDSRNCQAQILQIFSDQDNSGQLVMYRIPIWSEDGSKYRPDVPSVGVRLAFDSVMPR
jgi:calcineurin-like phosphoesterase family protein